MSLRGVPEVRAAAAHGVSLEVIVIVVDPLMFRRDENLLQTGNPDDMGR